MAHAHHHHQAATGSLRAAFFLNLGFALFELIGGALTNSVAVLSDALHDLGDSFSIGLAWYLEHYSTRGRDAQFSYGYRRFSILGAVINAVILIGGGVWVISESVARLRAPESFNVGGLIGIAIVGLVVNGAAGLRLRASDSLNAHTMSLHMLEDVLGWAAILVMGVVSLFVDLPILDPLLSLAIALFILYNAARSLRETVRVLMQAVPEGVQLEAVERELAAIPGVREVHQVRLWSLDGEHNVFTAHLVVEPDIAPADVQRIQRAGQVIASALHLEDLTIQVDFGDCDCGQWQAHEERANVET